MDEKIIGILERQIQAWQQQTEAARKASEEQNKVNVELKNEIKRLNATLSNGPLSSICKKVDKTFFAVAVLIAPLVVALVTLLWVLIQNGAFG